MHLEIPITLTRFGWGALEQRARADGFDLAEVTEQACAYYASELDGGRMAAELPRSDPDDRGGTVRRLSLELDDRCAEALDSEAQRQGVSLDRLVTHATLLYLSDFDRGRVADRVTQRARKRGSDPVSSQL
jgi:hypothetical protein